MSHSTWILRGLFSVFSWSLKGNKFILPFHFSTSRALLRSTYAKALQPHFWGDLMASISPSSTSSSQELCPKSPVHRHCCWPSLHPEVPQKLPQFQQNLSVPICKQRIKTLSHTSLISQAISPHTMGLSIFSPRPVPLCIKLNVYQRHWHSSSKLISHSRDWSANLWSIF